MNRIEAYYESPSHTVGSELKDVKNYTKEDWQDFLSLSHTVGLEHTSSIMGLLTFVLRNRHPTRWA
jgi:hypothetical protein